MSFENANNSGSNILNNSGANAESAVTFLKE